MKHLIVVATFALLATVSQGARAQFHTSPPPVERPVALDGSAPTIGSFSSLAGSYRPDRAYLGTDVLTGYLKGARPVFVHIGFARVVSTVDGGTEDERREIRDRISSVTTLVNNGGQQTLRVGIAPIQKSYARVAAYAQMGTLGRIDEDESGVRFDRVGAGGAIEAIVAGELVDLSGIGIGQLFLGGKLGYTSMIEGRIVSDFDRTNLFTQQIVIGARSSSGGVGMGVTLSFVPSALEAYVPKASVTIIGFGR